MKSVWYSVAGKRLVAPERPVLPHPSAGRHARWCGGCRRRTWHTLEGGKQRCQRCQQAIPAVFG